MRSRTPEPDKSSRDRKFPAIARRRDDRSGGSEPRKILATIVGANEPLLASVELFDVFSGKQAQNFGTGKKSMAYALTYRDKARTLTNEEITVVHAKVRERLQRELGVELRE